MSAPYDVHLLDVTADDIADWAGKTPGADHKFPRIIEELVHASSKDVSFHHFHSGKENNWPGFDGVVRHAGVHDYIPQGESIWEIGINKDITTKINADYQKRLDECSEQERAEISFVFVTPRKWQGKETWVAEKRSSKEWKDVRVYDATDIQTWLNENLTCKMHFAKLLGKQICGAGTLEEQWHYWANATIFPLSEDLFLRDIRETREQFLRWTRQSAAPCFVVRADSLLEGMAFLRCLLNAPELKREKSLAVVIKHEDALAPLIARNVDFIPIVCDENLLDMCVHPEKNLHTIMVRTKENREAEESQDAVAELRWVDFSSIQQFQKKIDAAACDGNSPKVDVVNIARKMGYCRVLIRSYMLKNGPHPSWLKNEEYRETILSLAMLGQLISSDDFSRKIHLAAQMLPEKSWRRYREQLFALAREEESPIRIVNLKHSPYTNGFMCGVHSLHVALYSIRGCLDRSVIDRLFDIYRNILLTEVGRPYQAVKYHIMRALLVYRVHESDWEIEEGAYLSEKTAQLHEEMLAYISAHPTSENLAYLGFLAEMLPDQYLTWWEQHPEQAEAISGSSEYGEALALLAVPDMYFMRAFRLMLDAAAGAAGGATTLHSCLSACFSFVFPQTNASVYERKRAFEELAERLPYEAINMVKEHLHAWHYPHCIFPGPSARLRGEEWKHRDNVAEDELCEFVDFATETALDAIGAQPDTVEALIESIGLLWEPHTQHACRVLKDIFLQASLQMRVNICALMSEQIKLGQIREENAEWLTIFGQMFRSFTASHAALEVLPYFSPLVIASVEDKVGYKRAACAYPRLVAAKLKQSFSKGINPIPYLLSAPHLNSTTLGECISLRFPAEFVLSCFHDYTSEKYPAAAVDGFFRGLFQGLNEDKLQFVLTRLLAHPSLPERLAYALHAPQCPTTWDVVHTDTELETEYWKHVRSISYTLYDEARRDFIVDCLLRVGNYAALLHGLAYLRKGAEKVALRVLRAVVREPRQELWQNGTIPERGILQIMQQLDKETCHSGELAKLEFRLAPVLNGKLYPYPHISRMLAAHPRHVARWYKWFERFRMVQPDYPGTVRYFLLKNIRLPRYCTEKHVSLVDWCREVLSSATEDAESVQQFVGSCLVDGRLQQLKEWLTPDICSCVECFHTPRFDAGFSLALENSIGVTTRSFDAGGSVERRFVRYIQEVIDDLELSDKHIGKLLRNVQSSLKNQGKWHDIHLLTERDKW